MLGIWKLQYDNFDKLKNGTNVKIETLSLYIVLSLWQGMAAARGGLLTLARPTP